MNIVAEPKPGDLVGVLEIHQDSPQSCWVLAGVVLVDAHRIGVRFMDGANVGQYRMLERSTQNREWKQCGA
ncbi:hypothetical protein QFZ99_000873 [Paraburkholderia atlantica]|uniref:hypothetical protein n=1 Tax=Paraburkholderia atlantica TaxID=2654982 RepID=UPI003D21AE46